jgi:hypothetical protein
MGAVAKTNSSSKTASTDGSATHVDTISTVEPSTAIRPVTWGTLVVYSGNGITTTPKIEIPNRPWQLKWTASESGFGSNFAVFTVLDGSKDLAINEIVQGETHGLIDVPTGGTLALEIISAPPKWSITIDVQDTWATEADCVALSTHWIEVWDSQLSDDFVKNEKTKNLKLADIPGITDRVHRSMTAAWTRTCKRRITERSAGSISTPVAVLNTIAQLDTTNIKSWTEAGRKLISDKRPNAPHPHAVLLAIEAQTLLVQTALATLFCFESWSLSRVGVSDQCRKDIKCNRLTVAECSFALADAAFCGSKVLETTQKKVDAAFAGKSPAETCKTFLRPLDVDPCK